MNNKDIPFKKQTNNDTVNSNVNNKNTIYIDPNIGEQDGSSNYPFYTPPGEGPQPRITSN